MPLRPDSLFLFLTEFAGSLITVAPAMMLCDGTAVIQAPTNIDGERGHELIQIMIKGNAKHGWFTWRKVFSASF